MFTYVSTCLSKLLFGFIARKTNATLVHVIMSLVTNFRTALIKHCKCAQNLKYKYKSELETTPSSTLSKNEQVSVHCNIKLNFFASQLSAAS